jgi:uncharacterized membrane protein
MSFIALDVTVSLPSDADTNVQMILRWFHFLAGITWIGLLYYFNLVNVNFMKALDAPTKGKVIPQLMPRALFWFRWGAVGTVLFGLEIYRRFLVSELGDDWTSGFLKWIVIVLVTYAVIYILLQPVAGALNKGWILGVLVAIVVTIMAVVLVKLLGVYPKASKSLTIGIGGGLGLIMLLNVWGIIWPHQKRIIAWTKENAEKGTAIPAESAKLARRAFLASRMNTFLSIPMLFFMGASSHYPMWGNK